MKHVFIINPTAGKKRSTKALVDSIQALDLPCEIVFTEGPGDARRAAREAAESGGEVRIYACGGDGTLNEVVNGAAGYDNAAMTCIPVGTGNDFLKNFGDKASLFSDPENLWNGPSLSLDAIDCNGRLALTVACSGFDAQVADDVHKFGSAPLLGGQGSYIVSLGVNFLLRSLGHKWTITLDGKAAEGEYVLAAVCNGRYYGGGFMPVAEARMDDGVLNTLIVQKVSRLTFLRFVGAYSKGMYYTLPGVARCCAAKEIVITSPEADIVTCLDGESVYNREVVLRLSERKVRFFGPDGCDPNATYRPLPEK